MVSCINELLSLIINLFVIIGIFFLLYFFIKLKSIESRIEKTHKEFEIKRDQERQRSVAQPFIDRRIENLEKIRNESIAPLERERQRIVSKIPFIK